MSPFLSNSTFFFFVTNYPIIKKKKNWSIIPESRLSKENENFTSHKFAINQDYQKIREIWQDISSNLT